VKRHNNAGISLRRPWQPLYPLPDIFRLPERRIKLTVSGREIEDETKITARLIDLVCEMTTKQQLQLLQNLDRNLYKKGRADSRRNHKIKVDYKISNRIHRNIIQDISAAGVFIETSNPPAVGEKIILSFSLAENKKPITITGRIVRSIDNGFAVDFRHPTQR